LAVGNERLKSKANVCASVVLQMEHGKIVGYARVSTDGQTLDAQHAALKTAGAERVFAEKVSGAQTERKALAKAIAAFHLRALARTNEARRRTTRTSPPRLVSQARPNGAIIHSRGAARLPYSQKGILRGSIWDVSMARPRIPTAATAAPASG